MEALVWIVLGVVLAVAEMFTGTLVLIMLAAGAFAGALAAALGAPVLVQALVFAAVSALSLAALRPVIRQFRNPSAEPGQARFGLEAIEGASGLVLEDVDADHGLVKIEGELWSARAYDVTQVIPRGERVRVVEVKGATAMVWRE